MQGEIKHFVKEFEEKRGDREVESVFKILETVTELDSGEIDKVKAQCDSTLPNLNAKLLVANSMCNKILDQARSSEIEQALESSKAARDKEWNGFLNDCKDKKQNVDDAYLKKENDIRDRYAKLEENLNS